MMGCQKIEVETPEIDNIEIQTKSTDPYDGTIWEYVTGERYNHYIYFNNDKVNRFLGDVNDGHLERWSEYNLTGYIADDIEVVDGKVLFGGELYSKTDYPPTDIEDMWMSITVIINPWIDE